MADALGNSRGVDCALLIVRLSVGGLMLFHGVDKLRNGMGGIESLLAAKGLPTALSYGVPVGEVLAPVLLIAGVFGRVGALILAFNMVMSIWLAFGDKLFVLDKEHGTLGYELNLLYLGGALAILFAGSGRYSLRRGVGRLD
jgi:putative oxidoreductase